MIADRELRAKLQADAELATHVVEDLDNGLMLLRRQLVALNLDDQVQLLDQQRTSAWQRVDPRADLVR